VIVLACNGIGTPRLLLNSQSPLFPNGLANSSGLVGKNLMYHPSVGVIGVFDERSDGYVGPISSTMLSQQFYETDPARGFVRGYEFQVLRGMGPVATANGGWARHPVPWGSQHHREFDELSAHSIGIVAMSEDLPEEHNDVTLDPDLADSNGIPAPKVRYRMSENTVRMLAHGVDRAREVMEAAGAKKVIGDPNRVIGGWHLLGTARMGDDPGTSVVDRWGGSHDVKNLFIIDGSVWVTAGGLNPTPTIQALALRTADYLKGEGRYRVTGR
jgi:choline dehydrogenase-like flavoprotein